MRLISLAITMLFVLSACSIGGDSDPTPDTPQTTPTVEQASTATDEPPVDANDEPTATEESVPKPTETATDATTPEIEEATPEPESSPTVEANPEDIQTEIGQISSDTADVRGLEILEDVDTQVINREQLRANLLETLEEEFGQEEADLDRDLLWMLRLIDDPELDYFQLTVDLLSESVLGYYNSDEDELFVVSEEPEFSAEQKITMSHEITHALQDQHYGLDRFDDDDTDYDRITAFTSLFEGDASWTSIQYAIQFLTPEEINQYVASASEQEPPESLTNAPRYIQEGLYFPYEAGFTFVEALINDGGFDAVDAALENPPVSTEQILHPEKYLSEPQDLPLEIDIPELAEALGEGWEETYDGTLGEFDLVILLEENGVSSGASAAAGWGATRFEMWSNGEAMLTVMSTRWDNEQEAAEFDEALRQTLASYDQDGDIWTDGTRFHAMISMGDRIVLTTSTDRDALIAAQSAQQVSTP